jgi:hypothetical protein
METLMPFQLTSNFSSNQSIYDTYCTGELLGAQEQPKILQYAGPEARRGNEDGFCTRYLLIYSLQGRN